MLQLKNNAWHADYIKLDRRLMAKSRLSETQSIIREAFQKLAFSGVRFQQLLNVNPADAAGVAVMHRHHPRLG